MSQTYPGYINRFSEMW